MITITINVTEVLVNAVAVEMDKMFGMLVNSCSTVHTVTLARALFVRIENKDKETLHLVDAIINQAMVTAKLPRDITSNDLTVAEWKDLQDLIACHAAVFADMISE